MTSQEEHFYFAEERVWDEQMNISDRLVASNSHLAEVKRHRSGRHDINSLNTILNEIMHRQGEVEKRAAPTPLPKLSTTSRMGLLSLPHANNACGLQWTAVTRNNCIR